MHVANDVISTSQHLKKMTDKITGIVCSVSLFAPFAHPALLELEATRSC
jgi:hypothetical protein